MDYFERAKLASHKLKIATTEQKNNALEQIAKAIQSNKSLILKSNEKDMEIAKANGVTNMLDRLLLTEQRIDGIVSDIYKVIALSDPIGETIEQWTTDNGLLIKKTRIPFGVIGVVYESRPNVTVDVSVLCIKTGNVCLLKGGKDAKYTNETLVEIIRNAISGIIEQDSVILLPSEREWVNKMITARGYVDVVIPRGSKGLINAVVENAKVPVIETGAGVCHIYVDKTADINLALKVLVNAKVQRPSVCNSVETLLVDKAIADEFLPLAKAELEKYGVILRGDDSVKSISVQPLLQDGYYTEYDSLNISVKVVDGLEQAVSHILKYGTGHSETIITSDNDLAEKFMNSLDSACVYVNASTRFTDGGCFGFGAELGISTQKLHARGPLGLKEMTSYHYKIFGNGQVRK
ncbi:MAG TPA: glutamate-5-semialdehyde dehydrogenase [Clostridiales bacterium]|nr:glutamate-5-semialdehyde dehydrogenase [Clostridiales bacterium]